MYFACMHKLFDPDAFAKIGRHFLEGPSRPRKIQLRGLMFSEDERSKKIGNYLFQQFWSSEIPRKFKSETGHDPLLLLHICTLRYHNATKPTSLVPWHLDANFYGFGVPFWTVWAPFVVVGTDAPGLEFSLRDQGETDPAHIRDYWGRVVPMNDGSVAIGNADLAAFHDDKYFSLLSKSLYPGDAFVFDQHVLHRTQILAGDHKERIAIEYRISSTTHFPSSIDTESVGDHLVCYERENGDIVVKYFAEHFKDQIAGRPA